MWIIYIRYLYHNYNSTTLGAYCARIECHIIIGFYCSVFVNHSLCVPLLLAIVLSVFLWIKSLDYTFGIFKLRLSLSLPYICQIIDFIGLTVNTCLLVKQWWLNTRIEHQKNRLRFLWGSCCIVSCVVFCWYLPFCPFSFGHCYVYRLSIYDYEFFYLQTNLSLIYHILMCALYSFNC